MINQSDIFFEVQQIDLQTECANLQFKEFKEDLSSFLKVKLIINDKSYFNLITVIKICESLLIMNKIVFFELMIEYNLLHLDWMSQLCENIMKFSNLQIFSLNIKENQFKDQLGKEYLKEIFKQLNNIIDLRLQFGQNQIFNSESILNEIKQLYQLQSFSLSIQQNQICKEGAIQIGNTLKSLTNLKNLSLQIASGNEITSEGSKGLGEGIQCLINLKKLHISIGENNIKDQGIIDLLNSLNTLQYLQSLSLILKQNDIGQNGFFSLGKNITCQDKLKELTISIYDNEIDINSIQYLTRRLNILQCLSKLSITLNFDYDLQFNIIDQLFQNIQYNQNIKDLQIQISNQNKLNTYQTQQIQHVIQKLKNIETLNLNIPTNLNILSYNKMINKPKSILLAYEQDESYKIKSICSFLKFYEYVCKDPVYLKKLPEKIRLLSNSLINGIQQFINIDQTLNELTDIYILELEINQAFSNKYFQDSCHLSFCFEKRLQQLTNLIELNIVVTKRTYLLNQIGRGLKYLTNLQNLKLNFEADTLSGEELIEICNGYSKLVDLISLSIVIHKNKLTNGYKSIRNSLLMFKKLQQFELKIFDCGFSIDVIDLFNYLIRLNSLISLSLEFSKVKMDLIDKFFVQQLFYHLTQLEDLSIKFHNHFMYQQFDRMIIDAISQHTKLKNLQINFGNLSYNNDQLKNIQSFSNLRQLQMTIKYNTDEKGVIAIGKQIENLQKLTKLDITIEISHKFRNNSAIAIGNCFYQLKNLKELNFTLYDSNIKKEGWIALANGIASLVQLNALKLHICCCDIQFAKILGDNIHQFTNLQSLQYQFDLSHDQTGFYFSKCLQYLINLTDLSFTLSENQINDKGMVKMGKVLQYLKNLNNLKIVISSNKIKSQGFIGFFEGLKTLINLKSLSFEIQSGKYIGETGMEAIGQSLECLQNLNSLNLAFGHKTITQDLKGFSIGFQNLIKLKYLSLIFKESNITSEGLNEISLCFNRLKQLVNLNLQFIGCQQFDVNEANILRQGLKNLKSLEQIQIDVPQLQNFILLSLLQDLPRLKVLKIDKLDFKELNFKREYDLLDGCDENQIIKLYFKLDNFYSLNGVLSNFQYLQNLDIYLENNYRYADNKIKGKQILNEILNEIKGFQQLKYLQIYSNIHNNSEVKDFIVGLKNISPLNLISLSLSLNAYAQDFNQQIQDSLISFSNLKYLYFKIGMQPQQQNSLKYFLQTKLKKLVKFFI